MTEQSSATVLFFAAARQRTGQTQMTYSFVPPYCLGDLKQALCKQFPELADLSPYLRWAINHQFVDRDETPIQDRDEVALIPPISGG